ncbi:unnamed protein product [Didymodactylos carnosus]|uniref:Uncharacterized protein n=1 Tax=Didymodactylos carnosus TaxID=1234261 RepID=A0A815QFT8_9BILA|nr:unnamed protein product [Didymodactylos carnosus]CAF4332607.1 unnamed protein product [Didymodactylos carnosus]
MGSSLNIRSSMISDDGKKAIRDALVVNTTLSLLNWKNISERDEKTIAESLKAETLIAHNYVSEVEGIRHLRVTVEASLSISPRLFLEKSYLSKPMPNILIQ